MPCKHSGEIRKKAKSRQVYRNRRPMIMSKKNKRGQIGGFEGLIYMIAMIAAFAIFILLVRFIGVTISEELDAQINVSAADHDAEISHAFGTTQNIVQNSLSTLWYIMFGSMMLGIIITAWFAPSHPVFVPIFIILLIVGIILGMAMSNAYEELKTVPEFAAGAAEQGSVDFMMSNLPYLALVTGLLVLVISFAKPRNEVFM